jgi:alpha-ketoglutarate-dependent taurine dioxygenase
VLAEYGVCVIRNLPAKDKMVKALAELIAPVQNTIYGEVFDVKVEENPINIAYSNVPLEYHMDLMYYESPPGLQFLHCLK